MVFATEASRLWPNDVNNNGDLLGVMSDERADHSTYAIGDARPREKKQADVLRLTEPDARIDKCVQQISDDCKEHNCGRNDQ